MDSKAVSSKNDDSEGSCVVLLCSSRNFSSKGTYQTSQRNFNDLGESIGVLDADEIS